MSDLVFNLLLGVIGTIIMFLIAVIAYFLQRLVHQLDATTNNVQDLTESFKVIAKSFEDFEPVHKKNTEDIMHLKSDVKSIKFVLKLD